MFPVCFVTFVPGRTDAINSIGVVRVLSGNPREGFHAFLEALALRQCLGELRPLGGILSNISVSLQDLGQDRKAIDYSEAAVRETSIGDVRLQAMSVHNLGLAYSRLGEGGRALESFLRALPLAEKSGDREGEARTLHSIAVGYANVGEWREALLYFGRSLAMRRAIGDRRGEATTLADMGALYAKFGDTDRAFDHYEKALALGKELRFLRVQAVARHRMGNIDQVRGDHDNAIRHYEEALKLYREARYRSDEAMVLAGIGRGHAAKGEFSEALRYYREALAAGRDPIRRALILEGLADAQLGSGHADESIGSLNEAIEILRTVGHEKAEAEALYRRAKAYESMGKLGEARADVERSLQLIERLRGTISTLEARALFLASYADVSALYIRVLMQLHRNDPSRGLESLALRASERSLARTLADYLSESPIHQEAPERQPLLQRQREIRSLLSTKAEAQLRAMGSPQGQERVKAIGREMDELTVEYDQLAAQLRAGSPRTAAMSEPESLDVAGIQREVVDSTTALLEYSLGKEKSFLWVVTPSFVHTYELPSREQIETAVRTAYDAVTNRATSGEAFHALTRMILTPAAPDLTAKRLLIVSDGALHYLPFAALPSPGNSSRPLIADHEIVNIPSASTLALLRRFPRRSATTRMLAVFADPVFDKSDERVRSGSQLAGAQENSSESEVVRAAKDAGLSDGTLPRLPFTRREANALLELVPSGQRKAALDFQASRKAALSSELGNYRIVHFATHGLLNSLHPELSGIVLSMVDEKGGEQSGFLTVADVSNMSLDADLVVLSGCRTALGKAIKGEGLTGLTRAFMYAGAPRVVASLWKVNDPATAELMQKFYAAMLGSRKLSPSAALRVAQLSLMKNKRWSDPYYWAGFVIQGEWN